MVVDYDFKNARCLFFYKKAMGKNRVLFKNITLEMKFLFNDIYY